MTQEKAREYARLGRNLFLTGPAGSGKTYLLNAVIEDAKSSGKKVAVTASTGIAATHIGGTTIHSWSGIGIADSFTPYQLDALMQKEHLFKRFKNTDVLIIDEISMFDAARVDMVDRVMRMIRGIQAPFGGVQVIFCGDFFQLPPITRGSAPVRFAFEAEVWQQMTDMVICYLDTVHRQDENDPLLKILSEMRLGNLSESALEDIQSRVGEVLPDHITPTRLYTHNVDVDALNDKELAQLSGKHQVFHMQSTGKKDDVALLKKYCMAPEELHLKIGAAVMCVKNNPKEGYVNGTLGTVIGFGPGSVSVQTAEGKEIEVYHDSWAIEHDGVRKAQIMQIPLRLAWAITVHKSQGMTLDDVVVDLSKSFTPGMGYVALSRVRSLSGLYIQGINQNALRVDDRVQKQDAWFRELSKAAE
ncbi:MAG: PIF1 family DEAD/DEAH box helicase [Candidatus Kerfeldbacteria bacterium]|nr:PIF1 family DEAD/DEAH box helicase [Candidatus Kerfeldbacteria bacterium]